MRTRMAISERSCLFACSASISSPRSRASSSESQAPVTVTFSPGTSSVRSVLPRRPSFLAMSPEAAPEVLGDVGVLVFVHQHVAEAVLVLRQNVRLLAPEGQAVEQEVAEI